MFTVSNAFLMSSATVIVLSDGLFWLKPVAMAVYKTSVRYSQNASVKGSSRVPKSVHWSVKASTSR